jgi:hypothetical protein
VVRRSDDRGLTKYALVLALIVLVVVAYWHTHRGTKTTSPKRDRTVAAPQLTSATTSPPQLADPDVLGRNLPPPPADFYRGGSAAHEQTGAERKLAAGEFPLRPPGFDDPAARAKFRAWWIDEYSRRTRIYNEHNPGEHPNDEETKRLLEALYDQGEPPRPGETAEQLDARQQAWFETWRTLTAAFGTPPKTVISFGGDPQYGVGAAPPVLPAGAAPLEPDNTRPTMSGDQLPTEQPHFGSAGSR